MAKRKRHLEFYKEYMKERKLPQAGLCTCAKWNNLNINNLELFRPFSFSVAGDYDKVKKEFIKKSLSFSCWGYDKPDKNIWKKVRLKDLYGTPVNNMMELGGNRVKIGYEFTPLRQNIILLMAAMAGEL